MGRRILGAVGLLLATVGFVVFVGLAAGGWIARREVDRRANAAAAAADGVCGKVADGVRFARTVLDRADADLARANAEAQQPTLPPRFSFSMLGVQMAARTAADELAGSVERARDAVGVAQDVAVVADAALSVFAESHGEVPGVTFDPARLTEVQGQLTNVSRSLVTAQNALGTGAPAASLNAVGNALGEARQVVDRADAVVTEARGWVAETHRKVRLWTLRAAVAVSALGGLAALGQVFMARACWRAVRGWAT